MDISGQTLQMEYSERKKLVLDSIEFPLLKPRDIPAGLVSIPVKVQDHLRGVEQLTAITAALVGMTETKKTNKVEGNLDCFQPRSG